MTEMIKDNRRFVQHAGIVLFCVFLCIATIATATASVTELYVNPEVVDEGGEVSITGKASAGETVWIGSSFLISLSVCDGKYSEKFEGIYFPPAGDNEVVKEKQFSVTAENVKDIRVSINPSPVPFMNKYPLSGPLVATNGIATLTITIPVELYGIKKDVSGKKNVEVYGKAAEGATSVDLQVKSEIQVTADSDGFFSFNINTGGLPKGEFNVTAGDKEKPVYLGTTPKATSDGGSSASETTPTPTSTPTPTPANTTPANTTSVTAKPAPSPTHSPTQSPVPTTSPPLTTTPRITATPLATSTPTPSPTHMPTSTPSPTPKTTTPDLKFGFAIMGLLTVAYLLRKYGKK
ncbi:MAG: hypothetical protein U9R10_03430, partial [Euryarchaeota archaeon]|nr:hypothetical protein [Euryarchaeota archaeon]